MSKTKTEEKIDKTETTNEDEEKKEEKPSWIKMKPKELEELVIKLAKEGNMPSKIGLILRDKYAIPKISSITEKKITEMLKESKIIILSEVKLIEEKISNLKSHMEKHKHDYNAKRALTKQMWNLQKAQNTN